MLENILDQNFMRTFMDARTSKSKYFFGNFIII